MLILIKSLFQFLVIIQVLSLLMTGNTKIGIRLTNSFLNIIQSTLHLSFRLTIKQFKFINKLICKANKYKSTTKIKTSNKQYQNEICTYNEKVANGNNNIVDIGSYIKQQENKILKD